MTDTKKKAMVITMSGDRPIHDVAGELKAAGFDVDQVLEFVGTVTGSALPSKAARLRKIKGVADVSEDQPVDIGPPDASVS